MSTSDRIIYWLKGTIQREKLTGELAKGHPAPGKQVGSGGKSASHNMGCQTLNRRNATTGGLSSRRGALTTRHDPRTLRRPLKGPRPRVNSCTWSSSRSLERERAHKSRKSDYRIQK